MRYSSQSIRRLVILPCLVLLFGRLGWTYDVTLRWDPSADSTVVGYKLHYGTATRSYTTSLGVGSLTSYTITGLSAGTFYFAVTAQNAAGAQSSFSNEVTRTFPVAGSAAQFTVMKTPVTITLDGFLSEPVWTQASAVEFSNSQYSDNRVKVLALYDDTNLYFAYNVQDSQLETAGADLWKDDGAEVHLDTANNKSMQMDADDYSLICTIQNSISLAGASVRVINTTGGYTMEIAIPWSLLRTAPTLNKNLGLLLGNNDRDLGVSKQFDWLGLAATGSYARPNLWGTLILSGAVPMVPPSLLPAPTNVSVK